MRILIFAPNYLPATRYGGPVRSAHGLARGLVAAGHEVAVLTTNVDGSERLDVPLDRAVDMDGVAVRYCSIRMPERLYYSPEMAQLISEMMPSVEVVHINGLFLWPGPHIARAARRRGIPVVISPRGMLMPEMVAGKSRLIKTAWLALQERATLRGARAIHATSEGEADGLRTLNRKVAPVVVVPNGVDGPERPPTPEEIDEIWGDVPKGRRVAFLARLDWTKGVNLAIETVRAHPDAVLRIAGHDQINLRAELEPRLRRDNGSSAGAFLGPLDGPRKWAFLAGADLLLGPSLRESFGMAVAEALAVGTPAIVTPGVGARELVAEVDAGLVVPRETGALNAALSTFLENHARRAAAGERARTIMAERYDWRAIAVRMAAVYSGETA